MIANPQAADQLEEHSIVIARQAVDNLFAQRPDLFNRFGSKANDLWHEHLKQRVMELAAAVAAGDPQMFASRLNWSRTAMRARNLTDDDVTASLNSLRAALEQVPDEETQSCGYQCIDEAIAHPVSVTAKHLQPTLDPRHEYDRLALHYLQAVVKGNIRPGMQTVLDAVEHGLPVEDAFLRVLLPAQKEVGRLWHLNELSIAEEHVISCTTERLMAALADRQKVKPDNGFTVVAGAVAGNAHAIAIRAISYMFEAEGWRTIYVGPDIPRIELPATINTYQADVVLLSVALTSQIASTKRAIHDIRNDCRKPVHIILGGNGLKDNPDLWQELGADGYATNPHTALTMAAEKVSATGSAEKTVTNPT
ncbi:MAG: cobalamin-dependent protein [Gammaproteobacteria bacterium]|nr:cobalamin-dependent protein [Gammaproteobacteria bacterium]